MAAPYLWHGGPDQLHLENGVRTAPAGNGNVHRDPPLLAYALYLTPFPGGVIQILFATEQEC